MPIQLFLGVVVMNWEGFLTYFGNTILEYYTRVFDELLEFIKKVAKKRLKIFSGNKVHLTTLFLITLIAILIRVNFLFQPIRYDEAVTFMNFASKPLYIGLSSYPVPNNHLFHTFLVHIAYTFLGNSPWVIRLPALIAGILEVPATYLATRVLYNKHAGLLSASFIASSSVLIEFSTNARGYTILILFSLLLLTLSRYIIKTSNLGAWFLFSIFSSARSCESVAFIR